MPDRLLIPAQWLMRHVRDHPVRLVSTAIVVMLASIALLGFALYINFAASRQQDERDHQAAVQNCIALNELRRQIYAAALDLNIRPAIALRFLPDVDCEVLP